jgi:hypothetical protein
MNEQHWRATLNTRRARAKTPDKIRMIPNLPSPFHYLVLRKVAKNTPITIKTVTMTQHILARACGMARRGGWRLKGGEVGEGTARRARREG